jgi:hypothetical protein
MMSRKETMTRRFYSTHSAVKYPPLLGLLPEAIEAGKAKLESNEDIDEIYIVEVVKIIRKVKQPTIEVIEIR